MTQSSDNDSPNPVDASHRTVSDASANNPLPIRDAACIIVVDGDRTTPHLLMGRRHKDQVFLPNKWVFPGGRVDASDRADDAHAVDRSGAISLIPKQTPHALHAFAAAGLRELHEETGLRHAPIAPHGRTQSGDGAPEAEAHILTPVARAITPPGHARRYDTWFFLIARHHLVGELGPGDGELLDCNWFTIEDARQLDIPLITRFVLEDAARLIDPQGGPLASQWPLDVPFYAQGASHYDRQLLPLDALVIATTG